MQYQIRLEMEVTRKPYARTLDESAISNLFRNGSHQKLDGHARTLERVQYQIRLEMEVTRNWMDMLGH